MALSVRWRTELMLFVGQRIENMLFRPSDCLLIAYLTAYLITYLLAYQLDYSTRRKFIEVGTRLLIRNLKPPRRTVFPPLP